MRLRVPLAQMMDVAPTAGARAITVWIRQRRGPEDFAPTPATSQSIRVVQSVPRLVAKDAHQPTAVATLGLTHDPALQSLEPRMREIERNGDARHAVRRKPLLRQPDVRAEIQSPTFEFAVEARDVPLQRGAIDGQLQIAETQGQQCFVGQASPRLRLTAPLQRSDRVRRHDGRKLTQAIARTAWVGEEKFRAWRRLGAGLARAGVSRRGRARRGRAVDRRGFRSSPSASGCCAMKRESR